MVAHSETISRSTCQSAPSPRLPSASTGGVGGVDCWVLAIRDVDCLTVPNVPKRSENSTWSHNHLQLADCRYGPQCPAKAQGHGFDLPSVLRPLSRCRGPEMRGWFEAGSWTYGLLLWRMHICNLLQTLHIEQNKAVRQIASSKNPVTTLMLVRLTLLSSGRLGIAPTFCAWCPPSFRVWVLACWRLCLECLPHVARA